MRTNAARLAEKAEEFRGRAEDHAGIRRLQARLVSLHGPVKCEEIGVLIIGLGENTVSFGIAFAACLVGLALRGGTQHHHVTVGLGANPLRGFGTLRPEFSRLAGAFRPHTVENTVRDLLGQVGAANADVDHLDAETRGFRVHQIADRDHEGGAALADDLQHGCFTEHAAQRR